MLRMRRKMSGTLAGELSCLGTLACNTDSVEGCPEWEIDWAGLQCLVPGCRILGDRNVQGQPGENTGFGMVDN